MGITGIRHTSTRGAGKTRGKIIPRQPEKKFYCDAGIQNRTLNNSCCRQIKTVDRHQFGFQLAAEDTRGTVAGGAGQRPSPQRAVDMDRSAGDDFRARCDRADDGDVALGEEQRLAGPDRLGDHQRGRGLRRGRAGGRYRFHRRSILRFVRFAFGRRLEIGGWAAVGHGRRHVRSQQRRPRALDAHDANIALAEIIDQLAQFRLVDVEAVDVEHHGPAQEEAGGAGGEVVKPCQPILEGQLRGKRQGEKGPPLEADGPGFR